MSMLNSSPAQIEESQLPFAVKGYVFEKFIGRGGFADVYLVTSQKFGQEFVAKVMTVDKRQMDTQWKQFTAEVTALSGLNYPNIIRMYDHFRLTSQFVLILEYCPNGCLTDIITTNVGVSYQEFQRVAAQVTNALAFCHSKYVAHRDIKPSNILIDKYGRMKLADFGLSLKAPGRIRQHAFVGSLVYIAPEIICRQANDPFKSDIWSLGVLFAVMAQGKSPWVASNEDEMMRKIRTGQYTLSPSVPDEIAEMIGMMLKTDPKERITLQKLLELPFFTTMRMIKPVRTELHVMTLHKDQNMLRDSTHCSMMSLGDWGKKALPSLASSSLGIIHGGIGSRTTVNKVKTGRKKIMLNLDTFTDREDW